MKSSGEAGVAGKTGEGGRNDAYRETQEAPDRLLGHLVQASVWGAGAMDAGRSGGPG